MNRPMNQGHSPNPWILYPDPKPNAKVKLFCFPYAGGGIQVFQNWPGKLPDSVELVFIQLPGRGRRFIDPLCTSVKELNEALLPNLLSELNKPYMLFGHSMGALVTFELMREMRRRQQKLPMFNIAAGRCAPQVRDKEEQTYDLPDEAFKQKVANMEGTPKEILENKELMDLLLPLLRADFQISETYRYYEEDPLSCDMLALGGSADVNVTPEETQAWGKQTTGGFEYHIFDGGHFFLHNHEEEMLRVLSEKIQAQLEKVRLA